MKRILSCLSIGMLFLGGCLLVAGLAAMQWPPTQAPPPPFESQAGMLALARIAPHTDLLEPTAQLALAALPTATTAQPLAGVGPRSFPVLSDVQRQLPADTATPQPSPTASPVPTAPPTPAPSPTPRPQPAPTAVAALPQAGAPPSRIVAPAINLDVRIVEMGWKTLTRNGQQVAEWVVPSNAAGWHINSALPGQRGNTVISGHNNVEGEVFRYVSELEIGDKITLYAAGQAYDYYVREKHLVKEAGESLSVRQKNAQWIARTDDMRLTLVTCWPYRWPGNTHRVIVVARP